MSETGNPIGLHKEWLKREAKPGIAKRNKFYPPSQPVNVTTSSGLRGLIISYDLNPEDDLNGYKVYCSDTAGFSVNSSKVVASGRSTQWNINQFYNETSGEIERMSSGNTYYLKVRAYDESDNLSELSIEVSEVAGQAESGDLTDGIIGTEELEKFAVVEDKLADLSVSANKIQNNAVNKDKTQGFTGTFVNSEGNTVTIENGLIISIN